MRVIFFKKWRPKCTRHKGTTTRNKCTKFGCAMSNGRTKKFGETSKLLQVHRGGGKFFSKNGNQNANVIKVQPQGISVPSLDALRATKGQKNREKRVGGRNGRRRTHARPKKRHVQSPVIWKVKGISACRLL